MTDAIFLSAGVPDPIRGPEFAATADTVAITSAVSALVHVVLGRRRLVWGGHPAITPMIALVAAELDVDYGSWVHLYQSRYFADEFPEDNDLFRNVTYTDAVNGDRDGSLLSMRKRMFSEHPFRAAVFIGGMGGIVEEFALFRDSQPTATVIPVLSTGGAALTIGTQLTEVSPDLSEDFDYVALFHRHLDISMRENRFNRPVDQPSLVEQRYWRPDE